MRKIQARPPGPPLLRPKLPPLHRSKSAFRFFSVWRVYHADLRQLALPCTHEHAGEPHDRKEAKSSLSIRFSSVRSLLLPFESTSHEDGDKHTFISCFLPMRSMSRASHWVPCLMETRGPTSASWSYSSARAFSSLWSIGEMPRQISFLARCWKGWNSVTKEIKKKGKMAFLVLFKCNI